MIAAPPAPGPPGLPVGRGAAGPPGWPIAGAGRPAGLAPPAPGRLGKRCAWLESAGSDPGVCLAGWSAADSSAARVGAQGAAARLIAQLQLTRPCVSRCQGKSDIINPCDSQITASLSRPSKRARNGSLCCWLIHPKLADIGAAGKALNNPSTAPRKRGSPRCRSDCPPLATGSPGPPCPTRSLVQSGSGWRWA